MMLKSMRATKLADALFDIKALDTVPRHAGPEARARAMAEHTPLGIGKAMTEFLARSTSRRG